MNIYKTIDGSLYHADALPGEYFHLVPQAALRVSWFPNGESYNSVWDFNRGPDGKMYAALCGELDNSVSAKLYEYFPLTGTLEECFRVDRELMTNNAVIPHSKIHTSIQVVDDEHIIMTTHTTARSPRHKYWMFDSHYEHIWEGYPGSHVLMMNTATREVKSLGCPVARDSIYGACYDGRNHAYWFTTFLRGHLFRLDLATREVRDFGQITEFGSYAIAKDRLGNMYVASRSGHLFHIDVDQCTVVDLGIPAGETETNPMWKLHRMIAHSCEMPDGRLLLNFHFSDHFYAIEPDSLKIEKFKGSCIAEFEGAPPQSLKCMEFDSQGILWYLTMRPINIVAGSVVHVFRWDITGGKTPEFIGMLGTPDHTCSVISESIIDGNDVWHLADSNHGDDLPGIFALDLKAVMKYKDSPRLKAHDVSAYLAIPGADKLYPKEGYEQLLQPYIELTARYDEYREFMDSSAATAVKAESFHAFRLWEHLPRNESAVKFLQWLDNDTLCIAAGVNGEHWFCINHQGKMVANPNIPPIAEPELPTCLASAKLPFRQGRKYLATASAACEMADGTWLVGTKDAMLCLFYPETGKTFSLGAIGIHGPVHALAATSDGRRAYGVSGANEDLGHVFCYDFDAGLIELGRLQGASGDDIVFSNTQPNTIAVSPDGKFVAVGTIDTLTCVYIYKNILLGD